MDKLLDFPDKANYLVVVIGPGMNVNQPAELIKQALAGSPFTVTEENELPDKDGSSLRWLASPDYPKHAQIVHLRVVHCPWGG